MLVLICLFDGEEREIIVDAEWLGTYIMDQLKLHGDRFIVKTITRK